MHVVSGFIGLAMLAATPARAQMSAVVETQMDRASTDVERTMKSVEAQKGGAADRQAQLAYEKNLRVRRAEAEQYATAARSGTPLPADAASALRRELEADVEQWRGELHVGHQEAQAMRGKWLVPTPSLTAVQWAQQRADWWTARDAWVAAHRP